MAGIPERKDNSKMSNPGGKNNWRQLFPAAVILVLSSAVYVNTLVNGFVWDDVMQVLENHWIRNTRYLPDIFSKSVWSFEGDVDSNYYRPMMHVF